MPDKETFLVATTASERAELWLVQTTEGLASLTNRVFAEVGSHHRATISKLSLDAKQPNNCFGGQLLATVVDVNPAEGFYLHIQEALHTCIWRARLEDRPALLEAAMARLQAELTRQANDLAARKEVNSKPPATGS